MQAACEASPRRATYAEAVDRESAREMLAAKLEAGAAAQAEEEAEDGRRGARAPHVPRAEEGSPDPTRTLGRLAPRQGGDLLTRRRAVAARSRT